MDIRATRYGNPVSIKLLYTGRHVGNEAHLVGCVDALYDPRNLAWLRKLRVPLRGHGRIAAIALQPQLRRKEFRWHLLCRSHATAGYEGCNGACTDE
jgi:hypothetical protein